MSFWIDDELKERRQRDLYRHRRPVDSSQGPRLRIRQRDYLNFASNDYLNLASDPRLSRAASRAAKKYGCGAGASPLVSGHLPPLRALERALAQWEGTETALVFSSGFAANLALVTSLIGREDVVFSDEQNHASLIDGCRLSRARVHVYRHRDANQLADLMRSESSTARRRLIVSDTVFSMEGSLAPLPELYDLARRYDAMLLLDEAHATGVLGQRGCGAIELYPLPTSLDPDAVIRVGTLSKALGTQGGFVSGSRQLIRWLVNSARPYIFSTALAPPTAAAAREAVRIVQTEPQRREKVLQLSALLGAECPIVPLVVGDAREAVQLSARLRQLGILAPAIRPPSVPEGAARLRISLTAGHTREDVARLLSILENEGLSFPLPVCRETSP